VGAVIALIASSAYGVSDFLGGISSRAKSVLAVLAVSQATGLVIVLGAYGLHSAMPLVQGAALWAIGAGVAAVAALGLLYLALAQGDVVVVAPLASAEVIVPVTVGLATGIRVTPGIWAGLALSIAGMIAASWSSAGDSGADAGPGDQASRPRHSRTLVAAGLALASSGCSGLFLVLLSHASMGDPLAATSVVHVTSCVVALAALAVAVARRRRRTLPGASIRASGAITVPTKAEAAIAVARIAYGPVVALGTRLIVEGWLAVAACGIADATADISYAWASMGNQVAVAAVVTSLYPVVTMVLAMVFLRERPGLVQGAGAVAVLAGVFLLTVAGVPVTHMMAHMPPVAAGR
jgi:drug/metabolite transporter (DMT)-like permease